MELRDGDLTLRSWTEDDVPALVVARNDPEITHWIPVNSAPYTVEDAFALGALVGDHVAEKVGFRREGVLRAHLRHPDGRIRDSVMFSLLPGELVD